MINYFTTDGGYEESLLTITNRFQKVLRNTLNFNEINFRILRIPIQAAKANTVCDIYPYPGPY